MGEEKRDLTKEVDEIRGLLKALNDKIQDLAEVVKGQTEVNKALLEVLRKEAEPPVDTQDEDEFRDKVAEETKEAEEEKDSNDGTPVETGDKDEHERKDAVAKSVDTPEPPNSGESVTDKELAIRKFLRKEIDVEDFVRIMG